MSEQHRRKGLTGWIIGAFIAIAAVAVAATLTVTVTNITVGGVDQGPAPCDTEVDASVGAPTYNGTTGQWTVDTINVTNIAAACDGATIYGQLVDENGAAVGATGNTTIGALGTATITLPAPVNSANVTGAAVAVR